VVGLVGSPEKAARVTGFGADAAIDYRAAPDLGAAVAALFPGGINVFFDSVGAAMLERMLPLMAEQGRIVACGMIADYNDADQPYGVKTLWQIVLKRLTMRGFLLFDHTDRLAEAAAALEAWALDGSLKLDETIYEGVEAAPAAFIDLMSGRTIGKTLVKINNESL
jgi:NADPH-dependent curcumin reductase CurA